MAITDEQASKARDWAQRYEGVSYRWNEGQPYDAVGLMGSEPTEDD